MAIFRWLKASNCKTRNVSTLTCSVSLNPIWLPWLGSAWLSISRHPRMSLETSLSDAMAIGRRGKFNRISLVILSSSMCALIKTFIAISRPNNGLSFSHTEIIKTFNQRAKKKRSSRSFLFFGASIGDSPRCCHDTRMESVNVATGSCCAGGRIRSTNQLLTDQSTAN